MWNPQANFENQQVYKGSIRLTGNFSVFQAEISVMHYAVETIRDVNIPISDIVMLSDHQALSFDDHMNSRGGSAFKLYSKSNNEKMK